MRILTWEDDLNGPSQHESTLMLVDTEAGWYSDQSNKGIGVQSKQSVGYIECVARHFYDFTATYQYIHYGPEISNILGYSHMTLAAAKTAVLIAVKLRCDLEVDND